MKYYVIAGEASGDLHGSNLMRGLYARDPGADIRFWGGGLMDEVYREHQEGDGLVCDYREGAIIGIWEVIVHARQLLGRVRSCEEDIAAWKPDVVILIDYPGFNFRIAEFAHKAGFKVFWYIAPKVWASREKRIKKLKAYVDKLFIVFPFEIDYFRRKGVDFIYRGNPLVDAVDRSEALHETREAFLERHGLDDKPVIALLAGSRNGEIRTMMPTFMETAARLHAMPEYADCCGPEPHAGGLRPGRQRGFCPCRLRRHLRRASQRPRRRHQFRNRLAGGGPHRYAPGRGLPDIGPNRPHCAHYPQNQVCKPRKPHPGPRRVP